MILSEIERRWNRVMASIYDTAKRELGYNASRFIQMVCERGVVSAARQLARSQSPSDGFTFLWEHHRLDLTVEAHMLDEEYVSLFSDEDRRRALDRLNQYGWTGRK